MKILALFFLTLFISNFLYGQYQIKGATNILTYNSGRIGDLTMILKNGGNIVVGFHKYYVEVTFINKSKGQDLLVITEKDLENYLQVAEYDFDNDGTSEIVIIYGDGISDMTTLIYKRNNNKYEEIGNINTGQKKCFFSFKTITLPFGSQGLYFEYKLLNGKFIKTVESQ